MWCLFNDNSGIVFNILYKTCKEVDVFDGKSGIICNISF